MNKYPTKWIERKRLIYFYNEQTSSILCVGEAWQPDEMLDKAIYVRVMRERESIIQED